MVEERSPGCPTLRVSGAGLWAKLRLAGAARVSPFWPPVLGSFYFCAVRPHWGLQQLPLLSPSAPSALQTTINTPHYKEWPALFFFTRAFHVLASPWRGGQDRSPKIDGGGELTLDRKWAECKKIRRVSLIYGRARLRRVDMCIYKCADRSLNIQTRFMIVLCPSSG